MGLTTAMYTGLTGLQANQARIETIGNNIANVNTTAFKGSRTLFQTQLAQTLSLGTPPSEASGGTNPMQIGRGTMVGTTQRDTAPGALETTGIASDLAIHGRGFFVVRTSDGGQLYTRDGSFALDSQSRLVTMDGHVLQGFGVDQGYHIVPGVLRDITIPLGTATIAKATEKVLMDGDLSAAGTIATQGSGHVTQTFVNSAGAPATGDTALSDLRSASNPGVPLFADGDTLTLSGATKGERTIPPQSFVVGTTGKTLTEFAAWLEQALAIQRGADLPGDPGVTVRDGALVIRGNAGEQNGLALSANSLTSSNPAVPLPLLFTQTAQANGSSVYTSFTAYDSLGTPVSVNVTFVLAQTPNTGPVWRYYVESPDASGSSRVLGTGTVSFDTQGNFREAAGNQLSLNRSDTGAATPLTFTLDFTGVRGLSTRASHIIAADQDGFPPGMLTAYTIGQDGTISGIFTNGLRRTLGQVAVAAFANDEGLVAREDNLYAVGPNSGAAVVTTPGQLGTGTVLAGTLELSNVDLPREFIGLVASSAGFQASSRVISVSSDLLNQLLLIMR